MATSTSLARAAGVLYLLIGLVGGFAEGFVQPRVFVTGDAAAAIARVLDHAWLMRAGVVAELVNQVLFVWLALTLYALFREVHAAAARAMVGLVVVAASIASLNAVFAYAGLQVATRAVDLSVLGADGSRAVVLLLLDTQHHGLLAAQVFFGLWLGYLAHKSGWFPNILAALLALAAACYLVDVLTAFLVPDLYRESTPSSPFRALSPKSGWSVTYCWWGSDVGRVLRQHHHARSPILLLTYDAFTHDHRP